MLKQFIDRWRDWLAERAGLLRVAEVAKEERPTNTTEASPWTGLRRAVRDALVAVERQFDATRLVDACLQEAQAATVQAWLEREAVSHAYYDTLRGMLGVLDILSAAGSEHPTAEEVRGRLEQVLQSQGIESIAGNVGDGFSPDTQCCEQCEESEDLPPGKVTRVLETGYQRRRPDGVVEVVRPARVVVSRSPATSKETCPCPQETQP